MVKTVVISVRVPVEVKKEIEELGFQVPVFVREAIEEKLRRRRAEEALKGIKANRVQGREIGFDSAEVIRRMRETF
jgi:Arc/MetJ-type ribon-helix-helix transcriptional regulator